MIFTIECTFAGPRHRFSLGYYPNQWVADAGKLARDIKVGDSFAELRACGPACDDPVKHPEHWEQIKVVGIESEEGE